LAGNWFQVRSYRGTVKARGLQFLKEIAFMTIHFTPAAVLIDGKVDRRLAFLARAAARFELVQAGEMDIGEAYDGLIVDLRCDCDRDRILRWERLDRHRRPNKTRAA
jgi:hypothetical protein